ncbi:MAG: biotin--[acetyl-CoA-carboxylase] ligase [Candidatus Margulisiibacteriota bacterium]
MKQPIPIELGALIQPESYFNWIDYYDQVSSTHEVAEKMIQTNPQVKPGIVIADFQSAGKGRFNKSWDSKTPGLDLLMTLIIHPQVGKQSYAKMSFPIGIAIREALLDYVPSHVNIQLKWPNDILINQQKCVGILITSKSDWNAVMVGIGINVNQDPSSVNRTSLAAINHHQLSRWDVLNDVISSLNQHIADIRMCRVNHEQWTQCSAYLNENVTIKTANEEFCGCYRGINEQGGLRLEFNNQIHEINRGYEFRQVK